MIFNTKVENLTSEAEIGEENWNDMLVLGTSIDNCLNGFAHYQYIHGYEMAARLIYEACIDEGNYLAERDQLLHPYLFLCRHTIELRIKALLKKYCSHTELSHNLKSIWKALAEYIVKISSGRNVSIVLENLSSYIDAWELMDYCATRNRYPEQKAELSYKKRTAISIREFNDLFEKFCKQMKILEHEIEKTINVF